MALKRDFYSLDEFAELSGIGLTTAYLEIKAGPPSGGARLSGSRRREQQPKVGSAASTRNGVQSWATACAGKFAPSRLLQTTKAFEQMPKNPLV